jgi:tRNA-dihydrouridine synthase
MVTPSAALAPMAELSHRALRELIEGFLIKGLGNGKDGFSPPVYYTEMISAAGLLSGGPFERWYLDSGPRPDRLVYQLLGAEAGKLAAAAALLDKRECLGIDINLGCAAPAIVRTGAGAALMEDPEKAARIVAVVRAVTAKRLSVKLRIGPKSPRGGGDPPGFEYLAQFCRRIEDAGADALTLHPRTAAEKFKRRARWEYVEALRKEIRIPLTGNGDIATAEELARRAREGPVMVGRAAVRKPWIFAEAAGHRPGVNLEETALRFLDMLARHQPPEFHLSRARRFFHYYCDNFKWAEYLRNRINREESLAGIGRIFGEYCSRVERL